MRRLEYLAFVCKLLDKLKFDEENNNCIYCKERTKRYSETAEDVLVNFAGYFLFIIFTPMALLVMSLCELINKFFGIDVYETTVDDLINNNKLDDCDSK